MTYFLENPFLLFVYLLYVYDMRVKYAQFKVIEDHWETEVFQMTLGHSTQSHPLFLTSSHKQGRQSFFVVMSFLALAHLISAIMSAPPVSMAVTQASMTEVTKIAHSAALVSVHSSLVYISVNYWAWLETGVGSGWTVGWRMMVSPRMRARAARVVKMRVLFIYKEINA